MYVHRKKRDEWPESLRLDPDVKELDPKGNWVLCKVCTENFKITGKGRRPNDAQGYKIKMNGKFQEAAWIMHKTRVVAHRNTTASELRAVPTADNFLLRDSELDSMSSNVRLDTTGSSSENPHHPKRPRLLAIQQHTSLPMPIPNQDLQQNATDSTMLGGTQLDLDLSNHEDHQVLSTRSSEASFFMEEMKMDDDFAISTRVVIPRTGWRCPGIVPDTFYQANTDLVHAFAKYYVGSYRINVVRDIRLDRIMLFSHDCENRTVQRDRPGQPLSCPACYEVWTLNKSFKRILKRMDRYIHVEEALRHSWSLTPRDLIVLSNFKHLSNANLNVEGRKLKQAAVLAIKEYRGATSLTSSFESDVRAGFNGEFVTHDHNLDRHHEQESQV